MTTLYFAYGSNMDADQMGRRCPGAECAGDATLPGYRFIVNQRGYATILPKTESEVPGVLWRVGASDEAALDRYEGYRAGLYDKAYRTVRDAAGNEVNALVYIDHRNCALGAPRSGYLERIIAAAEGHGLPETHLCILRAWPRKGAFGSFNRLVGEVKAGRIGPRRVKNHGEFVARWIKEHRDVLFLDALGICSQGGEIGLDSVLVEVTLNRAREIASRRSFEEAGGLALEGAALARLRKHLDSVRSEALGADDLAATEGPDELAGRGIIITNDAARAHEPEDRFIVTKHAPVLAALWRHIFKTDHGVHPITCPFMEAFAEAVERGRDTDMRHLVQGVLDRAVALVAARQEEVQREIDSIG